MNRNLVGVLLVAILVAAGVFFWTQQGDVSTAEAPQQMGGPLVDVTLVEMTGSAKIGAQIYTAKCAACHGENAAGRDGFGPPFIHKVYEPNHHGDFAFMRAPRQGVTAHHWPFGNMPPIEGLTDGDIKQIIDYVRTLQRANGIG